jgi:lysophospholipase L1-like esterase
METGDPPAGWPGMNRGVVKRVADPRSESAGAYALSVTRGTYNDAATQVTKSAVKNGNWFTLSGWSKSMAAGSFASFYLHGTGYFTPRVGATSVNWGFYRTTGRCESADGGNVYLTVYGAGNEGRFDDMDLRKLTFPSLFRWLPATSVEDLGLKCSWDLVTGPQLGVAARWDSASNPTSGIVAYYSSLGGYKIFVDRCINGTWSNLSAKTITPDSVHSLYLEIKGTIAKIYYNQTLLDTVTIDKSLVGNENNGLFSTAPEAKFSAFSLWKHRTTRMLVLGDSIANEVFGFGYRVPWAYPGLVTAVNRAVVSAVIVPDGTHSDLGQQVAAAASDNADIVLINLGVKDGAPPAAIQSVIEKQIGILKTSNPNAKIYMLRILPKTVDDHLQDAKRAAISAGCATAGVTYWDTSDWIDPVADTGDGLHPNVKGHEKITKRIMALLPL